MKIKCRRDKFVPLFSIISAFASGKDARLFLNNVKLSVDDSFVYMSATDGSVGGLGKLPVADGFVVEEPGEVVLPASLLKRILAETIDEEFTLETEGARILFKGNRCKYHLDAPADVEKFPTVEPFEEKTYFKIPAKSMCDLIRRTVFATDLDNTHYDLQCVKVIFESDRTLAVSTDGRRLAYQAIATESVVDDPQTNVETEALFLTRTLNLIERVVSAVDAEYVLVAMKNSKSASIKIDSVEISTAVKEGKFPDWRSIFPDKSGRKRVDFLAGELSRAIRQAEIVATENKPGVRFLFTKGNVNIAAAGESTGESSVDLMIAYDDEESSLRLDSRFLNEFFRNVSAEENVAFYFGEDYRTMFETSDGYQYIVMQLA